MQLEQIKVQSLKRKYQTASSSPLFKNTDENKGLLSKNNVSKYALSTKVNGDDNESVAKIRDVNPKNRPAASSTHLLKEKDKNRGLIPKNDVPTDAEYNVVHEPVVEIGDNESNTHETESNGSMTCGYEDTKLSKVYLGPEVWIDSKFFKSLLRNNKYSLFVKQLSRYLFGDETLMKSTVTGKTSNRKKKICKDKKEELVDPEQLDPILISIVRDSLKYYFRYKGVTDDFKINRGIADIPRLIAILSSDLKKSSQRPICKKKPEATANKNKENYPDNTVRNGSEKISDDDSEYTDNDNDNDNDTENDTENENEND
ncbi:uncharacterized protein LOC106694224 [Microplitis demolitor]|uniref:uncharacterized protein LOC106694224 n=1 Tax=Microplitis demolitor TaxID=69319 RepID=UPI0006D4CA60|nr:uncharacterized protein LOC106694224 [Microplitis demolitor]